MNDAEILNRICDRYMEEAGRVESDHFVSFLELKERYV